jgi:serine/tyrosine/threonine adenylyltransferase
VFSSIDQYGRYAYAKQPEILTWNLARLAETLIPHVDTNKDRAIELLTETIECIQPLYESYWLAGMRSKIGLTTEDILDQELINDLLKLMEKGQADFTLVFRRLSQMLRGNSDPVRNIFKEPEAFDPWAERWQKRLRQEKVEKETMVLEMDKVNPIYIPRNHKVEEALAAAINQDMNPFSKLLEVISNPFNEVVGNEAYSEPAPVTNMPYRTFCGT